MTDEVALFVFNPPPVKGARKQAGFFFDNLLKVKVPFGL
jgi:hypothetical protein